MDSKKTTKNNFRIYDKLENGKIEYNRISFEIIMERAIYESYIICC